MRLRHGTYLKMPPMRDGPLTEKPQPPLALRWGVLVLVSVAMFGNYYVYDSIAPLANILRTQLGFPSEIERAHV